MSLHESQPPFANVEPMRVLVVDQDDEARVALVAAIVAFGHTCDAARDGVEAWEAHRALPADVVLADSSVSTLELCRKIRESDGESAHTHVLLLLRLGASGTRSQFLEGMRAGADDCVGTPIEHEELAARLEAARRVVRLQRRLSDQRAVLQRDSDRAFVDARTDALTLTRNRLALVEDLTAVTSRVRRYGHRYCAAIFDVDHFKRFNDRFGHIAGDDVLRRIAQTIRERLRAGDGFYRYGGEEFLAVLPEQGLVEATTAMTRVRRAVEDLRIAHADDTDARFVTVSIGVAELDAETATLDAWLGWADAALYAAKKRGRNRVEVHARQRADGA